MSVHHHPKPAPFTPPIVRVDEVEITAAEIAAEIQHHPAADAATAWHAAAEALVIRRLLLAEAARREVDATPEADETPEEAQVNRLLAAELRLPEADEATCRRWFEANSARFRSRAAWHAAHVLLAADPADAEARAAARARAEAMLVTVQAEPDRLAALAAQFSDCPSRDQSGDLGLVEEGSTVPAFEAALRATFTGSVHPAVVETPYGFHVLRVFEAVAGQQVPFEAARVRVAEWLAEAAWRRAAYQYMTILASRAVVEGISLSAGADGPLVQ
ncbi:peptidylprolyl isomerase [Roseomonas frigidaquae]|uniref:Parvulin-like PPIase n=1 Tax=Falsiroseomonas frigidaquae TaxID=487318 RepID=A0ABX1EUN6_9PROT|nr:peptidylprolyl isomerase [Falsiroseomonas frigidaquae]NKE43803.1 peptidylprolyl isomerase [Falsiroseomonas frigidaquae]